MIFQMEARTHTMVLMLDRLSLLNLLKVQKKLKCANKKKKHKRLNCFKKRKLQTCTTGEIRTNGTPKLKEKASCNKARSQQGLKP